MVEALIGCLIAFENYIMPLVAMRQNEMPLAQDMMIIYITGGEAMDNGTGTGGKATENGTETGGKATDNGMGTDGKATDNGTATGSKATDVTRYDGILLKLSKILMR